LDDIARLHIGSKINRDYGSTSQVSIVLLVRC
jgi:hypothetical protein